MAFVQYSYHSCVVGVPQSINSAITMLVPVNSNSFLVLRIDNSFELRSIRENTVMNKGKLPKEFVPCALVKPINRCKEPVVYLNDRDGNICRINLREDLIDIRKQIRPSSLKQSAIGKESTIEYKILDEGGQCLLGWCIQSESINTNIFVYDWTTNNFSNVLTFTRNFYNFKIFPKFSMGQFESSDTQLAIMATGDKHDKIHCSLIELKKNDQKMSQKPQLQLCLVQRKQHNLNSSLFPIGGVYIHSSIFVVCNSPKKGFVILKYNIEQNASKQCILQVPGSHNKRGLFRKFLGIVDGNMLFSYKQNGVSTKKIYGLQINKDLLQMQMNKKFQLVLIAETQLQNQILEEGQLKDFEEITPSLDGFSFQQYLFECSGGFRKKHQKDKESLQTYLRVETTFRVPKKYNYYCMAEEIGLSHNMINEVLELL